MAEDDKLFQYWLTQLAQRESSTNTIVAITSSSTLVMLTLFLQPVLNGNSIEPSWSSLLTIGVGLTFAIIGLGYREVSKKIHDIQMYEVRQLMTDEQRQKAIKFRYMALAHNNWIREAGLRLLTIIPVFAWAMVCILEIFLKIELWIKLFQSLM